MRKNRISGGRRNTAKRPRHVLGTLIFRSVSKGLANVPGADVVSDLTVKRDGERIPTGRNDKSSRCTVINVIDYRRWLAVCHEQYFPVRSSVKKSYGQCNIPGERPSVRVRSERKRSPASHPDVNCREICENQPTYHRRARCRSTISLSKRFRIGKYLKRLRVRRTQNPV